MLSQNRECAKIENTVKKKCILFLQKYSGTEQDNFLFHLLRQLYKGRDNVHGKFSSNNKLTYIYMYREDGSGVEEKKYRMDYMRL